VASEVVPRSDGIATRNPRQSPRPSGERLGPVIEESPTTDKVDGEVTNHILLEGYVLFCTSTGKVFVHENQGDLSIELQAFPNSIDIHGVFRSFGIIDNNGGVVQTGINYLQSYIHPEDDDEESEELDSLLQRFPALQQSGVLQLSFGDYHFHALHSNGKITSYGRDPGCTGALGLGYNRMCRGVVNGVRGLNNTDCYMLPYGLINGRAVWFHPKQKEWCNWMDHLMKKDIQEHAWYLEPWNHANQMECIGQLSEWVEKVGGDWDKEPGVEHNDDGLGAHFALSVAAGGWRGCALVLVNEPLVESESRVVASRLLKAQTDSTIMAGMRPRLCDFKPLPNCPNIRLRNGRPLLGPASASPVCETGPPACDWGFEYTGAFVDQVFGVAGFRFTGS
jgi:SCF-associated factor 1